MNNMPGYPELLLILVIAFLGMLVICACRICAKARYPWWFGLAAFVPFGNLLLILFLSFVKWPIETELETLRQQATASQQ